MRTQGMGNGSFCFPRFQLPTGSACTHSADCAADNFCSSGLCRSVALAQNCASSIACVSCVGVYVCVLCVFVCLGTNPLEGTGTEATPQCNVDTTCTCTASGDRKCIGTLFSVRLK